MRLFHGSNVEVRIPRLVPQVRALDFGPAFYLTSAMEQAAKWARTSVLRRQNGEPLVSVFELDESRLGGLKTLSFNGPTSEWLKFVSRNRNERIDDSPCDLVSGPVANDNTMPVLNLYFKGRIPKKMQSADCCPSVCAISSRSRLQKRSPRCGSWRW